MAVTDGAAALTALLCRGLSRLAVAAEGTDTQLDTLLAELRHLLYGDLRDVARLAQLIDAIEQRIRALDQEADDHGSNLQQALERLLRPLLAAPSAAALQSELLALKRTLTDLSPAALPPLLNRLADVQQLVLAPPGPHPRPPLWHRLFGGAASVTSPATPPATHGDHADSPASAAEPPFALGAELGTVLDHLLCQIEIPAAARDNHQRLSLQLERGLQRDELVPALQEVGVIVVTALEQDRGEFQRFLLALNQRLADVYLAVQCAQDEELRRREANTALQLAMREGVDAMQSDVQGATTLDQLKALVRDRLDSIVAAAEAHCQEELQRQYLLEGELARLTQQLQELEASSAQIDQEVAGRRQLTLLDMLTQLPNRQAFEQRLRQELAREPRGSLALGLCTIDRLAAINDRYGELAGDKVLRVVARTLRARMRRSDFVARLDSGHLRTPVSGYAGGSSADSD